MAKKKTENQSINHIQNLKDFLSQMTSEEFFALSPEGVHYYNQMFLSACSPMRFEEFFPDAEIKAYRDEKNRPLHGSHSIKYWQQMEKWTPDQLLDRQRRYIKRRLLPSTIRKAQDMLGTSSKTEGLAKDSRAAFELMRTNLKIIIANLPAATNN